MGGATVGVGLGVGVCGPPRGVAVGVSKAPGCSITACGVGAALAAWSEPVTELSRRDPPHRNAPSRPKTTTRLMRVRNCPCAMLSSVRGAGAKVKNNVLDGMHLTIVRQGLRPQSHGTRRTLRCQTGVRSSVTADPTRPQSARGLPCDRSRRLDHTHPHNLGAHPCLTRDPLTQDNGDTRDAHALAGRRRAEMSFPRSLSWASASARTNMARS